MTGRMAAGSARTPAAIPGVLCHSTPANAVLYGPDDAQRVPVWLSDKLQRLAQLRYVGKPDTM